MNTPHWHHPDEEPLGELVVLAICLIVIVLIVGGFLK